MLLRNSWEGRMLMFKRQWSHLEGKRSPKLSGLVIIWSLTPWFGTGTRMACLITIRKFCESPSCRWLARLRLSETASVSRLWCPILTISTKIFRSWSHLSTEMVNTGCITNVHFTMRKESLTRNSSISSKLGRSWDIRIKLQTSFAQLKIIKIANSLKNFTKIVLSWLRGTLWNSGESDSGLKS